MVLLVRFFYNPSNQIRDGKSAFAAVYSKELALTYNFTSNSPRLFIQGTHPYMSDEMKEKKTRKLERGRGRADVYRPFLVHSSFSLSLSLFLPTHIPYRHASAGPHYNESIGSNHQVFLSLFVAVGGGGVECLSVGSVFLLVRGRVLGFWEVRKLFLVSLL